MVAKRIACNCPRRLLRPWLIRTARFVVQSKKVLKKRVVWCDTKPTEKALRLAGVRLARFVPRLFRIDYLEEILANRLNLHIDESGNQDLSEGRYIVAVVLHDHSSDIAIPINRYEERLAAADLPDVPFHGKDLLHGNERYSIVTPGDRKRLLAQFARFVRELPISFFTLQYDTSNVHNRNELEARIRRDLASLVFARLAFFLSRIRNDCSVLRQRTKRSQHRAS